MGRFLTIRLVAAFVVVLALAPGAMASVGVGSGAAKPALRVDAKGNAEVSYTQGGTRRTLLVPLNGAVIYSGRLTRPDVSKAASSPKLPYLKVLRSGPGGWHYALQTWPSRVGAPELRFSRWQGAPTKLTFKASQKAGGIVLQGTVTYGGKAIPTTSKVPGGSSIREYVYLDQRVDGKWQVLGGASVTRRGTYRQVLHGGPTRSALRASVAGPNIGAVYAPDMTVQIPPP